jgi:hypothetical protein
LTHLLVTFHKGIRNLHVSDKNLKKAELKNYNSANRHVGRFRWPRGLLPLAYSDHGFESHRVINVCLLCVFVLLGRSLCDELITRSEESYRLWRVVVCDHETSWYEEAIARAGVHSQEKKNTVEFPLPMLLAKLRLKGSSLGMRTKEERVYLSTLYVTFV